MALSLTLFNSIYDNKTDKRVDVHDFNAFERVLYQLAEKPRAGKRDAELMSPALYHPNTTRANDNVTEWSTWCAVDVDDYEFEGNLEDDLCERFSNYRFVCYSTASSKSNAPKFRLVFPLERPVEVSKIKQFWFALQTELGELGDKQTKDLSRMYYIPGKYADADNFIFSYRGGSFIDPDILIQRHPMAEKPSGNTFFDRLPDEMKQAVMQHRKDKMDNTSVEWSSYRDCPYFPKKLAGEYQVINSTGWYHKMYQIMVAVASNAIRNKYPITAAEVSKLCREFDMDTGNWYQNRPLDKEADRAIEYVYRNL